jgi:16S rRNA (adenine1518-N6/adenine1519-N6)-dimethyltransferase
LRPARARKQLGQHFLHDPAVIAKLVAEIAPQPDDLIVEIGGGRGALTYPLLRQLRRLHVIELDRQLADYLREHCPAGGELVVHQADALSFNFSALAGETGSLRVVGNLPYNISTPLLFHLLSHRAAIADMHLMLQKEVARRIVANPGGKEYGRLTVMLAAWMDAGICFDVGPGAFSPPPQVWSSVLHIRPHTAPSFAIGDERRFAELVARVFSMRRKTLARALKGVISKEQIEALNIDPTARPETLRPVQFADLAALLP